MIVEIRQEGDVHTADLEMPFPIGALVRAPGGDVGHVSDWVLGWDGNALELSSVVLAFWEAGTSEIWDASEFDQLEAVSA